MQILLAYLENRCVGMALLWASYLPQTRVSAETERTAQGTQEESKETQMTPIVLCLSCKRKRDEMGNYTKEQLGADEIQLLINLGVEIKYGQCPQCQGED